MKRKIPSSLSTTFKIGILLLSLGFAHNALAEQTTFNLQKVATGAIPQGLTASNWRAIQKDIGGSFKQNYIKATNTSAEDRFGYAVALSGNTMAVGVPYEDGDGVDENNNNQRNSGAVYIYVFDSSRWVREAYLKAPSPKENGHFGEQVAIDGDTVAISAGAYFFNNTEQANGVYIFTRSEETWTEQAFLAENPLISALALDKETLVIGTSVDFSQQVYFAGSLDVFTRTNNTWDLQAHISTPDHPNSFGVSVALENDTLVVGAAGYPEDSPEDLEGLAGAGVNVSSEVYVYNRTNNDWNLSDTITPASDVQGFGSKVALSNNSIAVTSGIFANENQLGVVHLFDKDNGQWQQVVELHASNEALGDNFGQSLALDNNTLVIGAKGEDSQGFVQDDNSAENSGAVYVFSRNNDTWKQDAYIKAAAVDANDFFGGSIALSGDLLMIGATGEDGSFSGASGKTPNADNLSSNSGAVYSIVLNLTESHKSNIIFDWIERFFARFFPNFMKTFTFDGFLARGPYKKTGNFVGTKDGKVYVLGEQWGGLVEVGNVNDLYDEALNARP